MNRRMNLNHHLISNSHNLLKRQIITMPPNYVPPVKDMPSMDSVSQINGYESWNSEMLADYFEKHGLGDYREVIMYHRITGKIAPQLTDSDLKDMGVKIVGDRCRFRHLLKALGRKARSVQRNKLIWGGAERVFFGKLDWCVGTCVGLCPVDPSTYKLTNNHLRIRTVEPVRVGPIRLCCCAKYSTNNIDLTHVDDLDTEGVPAPCLQKCFCCADGKEILEVSTNEGDFNVIVREGDGDRVSNLIMNQVEECQMIERD